MLVNTLHLKSALGSEFNRTIGELLIINNTTYSGKSDLGNYDIIYNNIKYKDAVTDFNRKNGAWQLLYEVLQYLDFNGVL